MSIKIILMIKKFVNSAAIAKLSERGQFNFTQSKMFLLNFFLRSDISLGAYILLKMMNKEVLCT